MIPPARRRGRPFLELLLVFDPVVLVGVGRVDHFGDYFVVGLEDEDGSCVFVLPTVVSGREDSDQGPSCKSLESVHDALMGPDDHVEVVLGQEAFDSVRTKLDNVACL